MEALTAADVVTEHTIFSALAPVTTTAHVQLSPRTASGLKAPSATSHAASPGLPLVSQQSASSRYIGSLTTRLPPKTPRSLMNSFPITADECAIVWKFLCDWVQTQVAMEVPAAVPRFGIISMKVHALNIRIPHFGMTETVRDVVQGTQPDQSFLDAFGLQVTARPIAVLPRTNSSSCMGSKSADKRQPASPVATSQRSDVFTFNFLEMASCCGSSVDAAKAQEWLQAVIQKIGQAMSQCKRVELSIGVGVISCSNRVVEQQMVSRSTLYNQPHSRIWNQQSVKPTLEFEIRTGESVVKRNILSKKSAVPKAKSSFLTSGDFSQAIQVNPVHDNLHSMPNFKFDLTHPRRPPSQCDSRQQSNNKSASPLVHTAVVKASPRSQQLQARYQRAPVENNSEQTLVTSAASMISSINTNIGLLSPEFPLLFDTLSRTLCVEPDQNTSFLQPSNRIATNYTPSAALLTMQKAVMVNGNVLKSSVTGIMMYEVTARRGSRSGAPSTNNGDISRIVEPGTTWVEVLPGSPGRKRKLETIRYSASPMHSSKSPTSVFVNRERQVQAHDAKSEERYFVYISGDDRLIERCWLAPITSELIDRIVSSAVKYLTESPSGHMVQILNSAQQEFIANYYVSAKKAMLDYILLRERSCLRLGIPHGTPAHATLPIHWKWGNSNGNNGCLRDLKILALKRKKKIVSLAARERKLPRSGYNVGATDGEARHQVHDNKTKRRQRVKSKLSAIYMLSNPLVRKLQALWHEMESSILLVNLPSVETLSSSNTPLDLHTFENEQLRHAAQMKAFLVEHWYRKVKVMIEDAIKSETYSVHTSAAAVEYRTRHHFDTIGALMSLQIRSLIVKSVKAYVAFFELFGKSTGKDPISAKREMQKNENQYPTYSGLLISLAMQHGEVQFRNSLVDIPSHLLSVLHNLPQLFHNVGRIEAQFDEPLQFSTPSNPFLWNMTSQEDDIALATIRIREIVEHNLCHLRQLQMDYTMFAHMHQYVCSIDIQGLAERSDVATCRAEMEKVRATAVRVNSETHDKQYLRLFCVDCSHVNTTIIAGLACWANRLLHDFQEHTSRLNAELRHEYKDVAAKLAKKPMDLYELVDAEEFANFLKTTKINDLQEKADVIKERIQFLLFERGSVRIDTSTGVGFDALTFSGGGGADFVIQSTHNGSNMGLFRLSPDLLMSTAKTLKWRSHISRLLQDAEASLVNERARIETIFLAKRTRFQAEIEDFDGEVKGFAKKGDLRHAATYVVQLAKMKDTLFSFRKTMEAIVEEEIKLQWKTTDFSKLDDIAEEMEPYEQLWKTAREFREMSSRWLRGNVFELEPSEGMLTLQQMLSVVSSVSKLLHLNSAAAAITAEMVKKQITDFRENARLVGAILNPSMKDRHLKEIAAHVGVVLDPQDPVTLLKLLENGAFDHLSKILEISQNATQEKQVEAALDEIVSEWQDVQFLFKPARKLDLAGRGLPKDQQQSSGAPNQAEEKAVVEVKTKSSPASTETSTLLLRSCIEELHRVVEENQVRLQSLLCMQHAIPFAQDISSWLDFTQNIRRLVDALAEVERVWKTLSPLFAANVIDGNSKESKLFCTADQLYTRIVAKIQKQPLCREVIPRALGKSDSNSPAAADSMLSDLKMCLELLEEANENLRMSLDGKRVGFTRFCFLTDSELVGVLSCRSASREILPESRELWDYLSPCFPGIHRVQVNASKEIIAAVNSAGEHFSLGAPIATANISITVWLGKIEISMTTILQASIRASISDSSRKEFRKWCLLWPEQVLLVAIQHIWTAQCEQANRRKNRQESCAAWGAIAESMRDKHGSLVKEMKAASHAHVRLSLSNILLLLRHLQDVSAEVSQELRNTVSEEQAQSDAAMSVTEENFETLTWLAQPRYYYEDNTFTVKLMTASPMAYGFEYLGNKSSAFFLTPLTLRCFQTIAQAASILNKGTRLEGASGAGKSSICSALSQTCGRLFVRLECANTLPFEFLLQFIRGAAVCGAWLAMENFQLIDRAQVSIVGYLCAHVMDSIAAKQSHCMLLGNKMRIKRGCHYFALVQGANSSAMTRGHSSSAQEARFFFKSVVVQTPGIEVITEQLLQQSKFVNTSALAKLIFVVLSAFERGFALIHSDCEHRVESMKTTFLNLRFVKRIVKRAMELSAKEPSNSHSSATGPGSVESTNIALGVRDASHDSLDSHELEKMEHKLMCFALREELSAMIPAAHLDLIEFLLRDFAANSLTRELRVTKSFLLTPRIASLRVVSTQQDQGIQLEDAVEEIVRTKDPAWLAFGLGFSQKVIQLLHMMKAGRAVVISGDIQSGKTALYRTLARALSLLSAGHSLEKTLHGKTSASQFGSIDVVAMTRCVVLAPRALTLDNLLSVSAEHYGSTLLANLVRDAKRHHMQSQFQTWLVLDGDIDASWSEKLLFLVEELQDDLPGHHKGLLLPSGKRVLLPRCVRLVMETTVLANVSPSFLTYVGVINLGKTATDDWRGLYRAWKKVCEAEFDALAKEIFEILDALLEETLDTSLGFVEQNFQRGFPHLRLTRLKSLLALFHSSVRQSWGKLSTMASGKQRKTAIHCFYLQSIVWGVGSTCNSHERQLFHEFLWHLIIHGPHSAQSTLKRVLVLFFPSDTTGTDQSSSSQPGTSLLSHGVNRAQNATAMKDIIYAFGFSVEYGLKWMRWTEYYELWLQSQASLSASSASDTRGGSDSNDDSIAPLTELAVPTASMAAAICLMNQLLVSNYPVLLEGMIDSGKTICGATWLALSGAFSKAQAIADSSMQPSFVNGADTGSATLSYYQQAHVGSSTSSEELFEQIAMLVERPGWKRNSAEPSIPFEGNSSEQSRHVMHSIQNEDSVRPRKMSFVFIDDLHCLDSETKMNSALELLRTLVEHRQAVRLNSNQLASCANVLPFASIRANFASMSSTNESQNITRLTSKFIPVTLPPLADVDLSSICMAIVSPSIESVSQLSAPAAETPFGAPQEAHQLVSIVIKSSIKLFRFLSGELSLYASKTQFDPKKLHYAFRIHDVFDVVRNVCCDSKTALTSAEKAQLARLWCHESARTFGDRLMGSREISIFYQQARDVALGGFGLAPEAFFPSSVEHATVKNSSLNHLWLASHLHFTFIGESSGAGFIEGYREVTEMPKVELSVERSVMAMHRANVGTKYLEIIICGYVIQHVLRLTRLLRSAGQNVLLIGSRGRKMATITRLAAFICKKTTITYSVPAYGHDTNQAKWKSELKNAILRSVRNKDERIVFIFKDSRLSSTEYYDAIERLVSGAKLAPQFLAYEDLDEQILSILRDRVRQEQGESRSSSRLPIQNPLTSKASVLKYFYTQVRARFQIVVILSEQRHCTNREVSGALENGSLARILWKTPQLLRNCAINYFGEWPEESLVAMAQKCFAMSSDVEKERAFQLSQAAAQLYRCTQKCLERYSGLRASEDVDESSNEHDKNNEGKRLQLNGYDQLPPLQLDPSMLIDQVGLFLKYSRRLEHEISANKDKFQTGLAFLDKTEQILVAEQAQAEFLQPEVKKKAEMTRRMSGTLEKEKLTSNKLNRALELAVSLAEVQNERLAHVESEYHELVKGSMAVFKGMQTKIIVFQVAKAEEKEVDESQTMVVDTDAALVDSGGVDSVLDGVGGAEQDSASTCDEQLLTASSEAIAVDQTTCEKDEDPERELKQRRRALIKSFVSIKPVPTALKQLAECLGLIFGIQPVEARDELDPDEVFMDYWESVTTRMKTKDFWDELIAYDIEARVNDKTLAQILPICTSPDFEKEMFLSLHELAGDLCEWVQAWSSFARDTVLAGPKFAQLMQEREAFTSAQSDVRAKKLEIQMQESTNLEVSALRNLSELERQEVEGRLQDNVSTLQMASSVWKVLASSREKWREKYEYYLEFSTQWMGDLMIGTSMIAYASCTSHKFRGYLRTQWSNELRRHCLIHSASRPLHQVFLVDDVRLSRWHLDGIPRGDKSAIENAVIISNSYRFPVLIDPNGVATEWVKKCEPGNKLQVMNCVAADSGDSASMWKEIEIAAKKQKTLLLTSFGEESAFELQPLLDAKRRSRYEVANRDISSAGTLSGNNSSGSVSISRFSGKYGGVSNYPCWFQIPSRNQSVTDFGTSAQQQQTLKTATGGFSSPSSTVEFGSESWRVYFVYSRTSSVPDWMLSCASQLSIVKFDFSFKFVETKCLNTVVEGCGEQHLLTEIQTLQLDVMSYQKQIDAIENEILDFFSTEQPEQVYADVSKALRIIGNRSAMHTLESSKNESEGKMLANYALLGRYKVIVDRSVDLVLGLRDLSFVVKHDAPEMLYAPNLFALPWIWKLLNQSLQQCDPRTSLQKMANLYIESARHFVSAGLSDENQVIFNFVLTMRLHDRMLREATPESASIEESDSPVNPDSCDSMIHRDGEVLYRMIQVMQCEDDNRIRSLCASVPTKLVVLRPDSLAPQKWRVLCYLADASTELREFIVQHADQKHKAPHVSDEWKELAEFDVVKAQNASRPLSQLSALLRLCVISVVHKELVMAEVEHFIANELIGSLKALTETPAVTAACSPPDSGERVVELVSVRHSPDQASGACFKASRASAMHNDIGLFDLWHDFSSPRTPIVVSCDPGVNFLHRVESVALKAKMTIEPQMFHGSFATMSSDDAFERKLLSAMQKGHWAVLPNLHSMPQRLARLQKLYEALDDQQLHSDFRLWVSSPQRSRLARLPDQSENIVFIDRFSVHKQQARAFALRENLLRTFSALKGDAHCRILATSYEHLLKRIGLLHTVLSTRDHFGFADWRVAGDEFGDGHLHAMINTLNQLDPQPNSDAVDMEKLCDAVRAAAVNVYGSSLRTIHDKMLLNYCLELVFALPSESENYSKPSHVTAAAVKAIPEIVVMLQSLESLPWENILQGICHLWKREEIGPDVSSLLIHSNSKAQDPFRLRSWRQQDVVGKLAQLFEESGYVPLSSTRGKSSSAIVQLKLQPQQPGIAQGSPVEFISKLALELENLGVSEVELAMKMPTEYKKPLLQLIRHELVFLNGVRVAILQDIRRMQAVGALIDFISSICVPCQCVLIRTSPLSFIQIHVGVQQLDEASWIQFCDVKRGSTPKSWMKRLVPRGQDELCEDCSLDRFQQHLIDRLKLLSSWADSKPLTKLPVDKFRSTESLLETIHQHFIRNYVGNTLCSPRCLQVVAITEDRGQATALSRRDDSIFIHGLRLVGHLQLDVVPAKAHGNGAAADRKKTTLPTASLEHPVEIRPEGVPVILEVTSACMATTSSSATPPPPHHSTRRDSSAAASGSSRQLDTTNASAPPPVAAFLCPIYRSNAPHGHPAQPETEICVMTSLPEVELVFSGSSLHISTFGNE